MEGRTLSHYRIVEKLGEGGMGQVYRALDTRLERFVALKVLLPETLSDSERRRRFVREAKAASALNHPGIVTVYEIGTEGDLDFIAMEHVEGETLQGRLAAGDRLPLADVVRFGRAIAEALAAAHAAGVVHRDVKPANVMVTRRGWIKILDFGLAKLNAPPPSHGEGSSTHSVSLQTAQGVLLGTVAYMSPEQAEGKAVDARSDVFSFGVLLYELICGHRPFAGSSIATLLTAILRDAPRPPRALRADIPPDLERIVLRCLEKDPARRYPSAGELAEDLTRLETTLRPGIGGLRVRRSVVVAALVSLVAAAGTATWVWRKGSGARWARAEAMPEITRLTEAGDSYGAFRLAREARRHLPDDARLRQMLERVTLPIPVATDPSGAQVLVKRYTAPDEPWHLMGTTPMADARVPYALMRWRIAKEGFETFEGAPFGETPFAELGRGLVLPPKGTGPPGMVRVPGGSFRLRDLPVVELVDYWLDRYEVTNREFKDFIDHGGYEKRQYWSESFSQDGRPLRWEEARDRLVDRTGRPGPASWELSGFPAGRESIPVGGVSWYEAAAYCASVGKSLPTIYHWYKAAAQRQVSDILEFSNFGPQGPAPVGRSQGLGAYGTYDMAGNVREWAWNETHRRRYVLGGAWGEPAYMYVSPDARPALDRSEANGIRCAKYAAQPAEALLGPANPYRDPSQQTPVSDSVFEAYRGFFSYARGDLKASVESVDESWPGWRREKVSFAAAYGGQRVTAHVFLPRNAAPPYQTVVWIPGGEAFLFPSSESLATPPLYDFLPRSGRALVYPVYQGTYERRGDFLGGAHEWRDLMVQWSKDLGRTLDYLETRADIDRGRIAHYGLSSGARDGPIFTTIDGRFKASVLLSAGLEGEDFDLLPQVNVVNYAPRSRVPTLMINGRDDFLFPLESCQRPLFRLLGVPDSQKRHVLLPGGHPPSDVNGIMKEVLAWLDRYLGPVSARGR